MEFQENYPVDKLIPYARNSRTHNDEQIAQIAASIKEFGFTNPILIGVDDVIIAGHGRLLAAQRMGLKEVPVIRLPHLTETQRRALVIADNKIALNAGWDEEMLALEMKELGDLEFMLLDFINKPGKPGLLNKKLIKAVLQRFTCLKFGLFF